jgi:hypothetical protein
VKKDCDVVFLGARVEKDLARLARLDAALKPAGSVWVIYPKGVKQITQAHVMAASKEHGFVDVKIVGFSETHSALKLVIPLSRRPG